MTCVINSLTKCFNQINETKVSKEDVFTRIKRVELHDVFLNKILIKKKYIADSLEFIEFSDMLDGYNMAFYDPILLAFAILIKKNIIFNFNNTKLEITSNKFEGLAHFHSSTTHFKFIKIKN